MLSSLFEINCISSNPWIDINSKLYFDLIHLAESILSIDCNEMLGHYDTQARGRHAMNVGKSFRAQVSNVGVQFKSFSWDIYNSKVVYVIRMT